ncbi:antitoxin Phd [Devosia sp. UYZn731]|uniref:type II toxin-antitoxin system Phd/YefM family antitoxin n=1 Tax=Devosia sp. UYZn731 TaxID=3156345 RepID=UPI003392F627
MTTWQVQQAKSHFSEVIDKAQHEGPQTITRHGVETAVVLSMEEYQRIIGERPRTIIDLLLGGPKFDDSEMPDFSRQKDLPRDIDGLFDDE